MFKNCVLRPSVDTVAWIKAAGIRAAKTMAQAALATIPAAVSITDVDWRTVAGIALLAGVMSLITSIVGVKEVSAKEE